MTEPPQLEAKERKTENIKTENPNRGAMPPLKGHELKPAPKTRPTNYRMDTPWARVQPARNTGHSSIRESKRMKGD